MRKYHENLATVLMLVTELFNCFYLEHVHPISYSHLKYTEANLVLLTKNSTNDVEDLLKFSVLIMNKGTLRLA